MKFCSCGQRIDICHADGCLPPRDELVATVAVKHFGANDLYHGIKALAQKLADTGNVERIADIAFDCSMGDEPYAELTNALEAVIDLAKKLEKR